MLATGQRAARYPLIFLCAANAPGAYNQGCRETERNRFPSCNNKNNCITYPASKRFIKRRWPFVFNVVRYDNSGSVTSQSIAKHEPGGHVLLPSPLHRPPDLWLCLCCWGRLSVASCNGLSEWQRDRVGRAEGAVYLRSCYPRGAQRVPGTRGQQKNSCAGTLIPCMITLPGVVTSSWQ